MGHFNPTCWVSCLDCGYKKLIRRSQLERRSKVRCLRCGGPVEPSKAAYKDLIIGMDKAREQRGRVSVPTIRSLRAQRY